MPKPELGRLRKKDCEFKYSLGYKARQEEEREGVDGRGGEEEEEEGGKEGEERGDVDWWKVIRSWELHRGND
jgi:hypothetical protein